MADQKITELNAHTSLIDTDVIPIIDITAVETKKTTWANIKSVLKTYFDAIYGSVTIEVPTGDVDGSNTTFTVSNEPKFVIIDGLVRRDTKGYDYADGTITVDPLIPPSYDIFSIY
jgi:hypothetical protein